MERGGEGERRLTAGGLATSQAAMIGALALALAGCSTLRPHEQRVPPPPPPPPAGYRIAPDGAVVTPPSPAAAGASVSEGALVHATSRSAASHRQYFDQRHKRYYFYDPARRAYFWEDGSPKT